MPIGIRDLDLKSDRNELIQFLHENLSKRIDGARFDWLYLHNPFGQGRAWKAINEVTGSLVGVAAAFPRGVWFEGKPRWGWVLGDFCVAADSRSLGPALLLQRACLTAIASEENSFWYDFPSRTMLAVYRRLGLKIAANHVRYVKLIHINSKVERHIPFKRLARSISVLGNCILRLQTRLRLYPSDLEMSLLEGTFQEEFTQLDSRLAGLVTVRGFRTAEYLNWRYLQNPWHRYRVVVARRGTELLGYAVLEVAATEWTLMDLQALEEAKTVPIILAFIDRLARTSGVDRLTAPITEGAPLRSYLRREGFHAREDSPVMTCAGDSQPNWYLMQGDRES